MHPKIYIASSWQNEREVTQLANGLKDHRFEVDNFTDNSGGRYVFHWSELVKDFNKIDAKSFLEDKRTQKAFKEDKEQLDRSNIVILLLPVGRSSHLEAGYAVGQGKLLFIFAPYGFPKGEFDVLYGFAYALYDTFDKLVNDLYEIELNSERC